MMIYRERRIAGTVLDKEAGATYDRDDILLRWLYYPEIVMHVMTGSTCALR